MSVDETKKFGTKAYPIEANYTSSLLTRVEPMLTPELLKSRYLKGIDLKDFTDDELKDQIILSTNEFESLTNLTVKKTQYKERIPYDYALYRAFLHFKSNHRPILSLQSFVVESSNGQEVYKLPADWVESGFFLKGQISLLPILTVFGTSGVIATASPSGALIFLQSLTNFKWLPSFWSVTYTAGLCHDDNKLPIIVNDVIGMGAAIDILSIKQNQIKYTSQGISQDGISQNSSSPGSQTFQKRIEQLEKDKERLMRKIRQIFNSRYYVSNI
jgi:hypothetical protein